MSIWDPNKTYEDLMYFIRNGVPVSPDPEEAERLERLSGLADNIPMLCRGTECELAARCPYSHRQDFIGTKCILETYEAYKHFSAYVRSLGVKSTDTTDVQMIADLVRLHILTWRIDQKLAIEGMTQNNETISGNRVSITRVSHPLLAEQRALIKSRESIYDKLVASRRSRMEMEERRGRMDRDFMRILAQMAQRAGVVQVSEHTDALPQEDVSGYLADRSDVQDEDDER